MYNLVDGSYSAVIFTLVVLIGESVTISCRTLDLPLDLPDLRAESSFGYER